MTIQEGGESHRIAAWKIQFVLLKIRDIQITCKVPYECLNVREPLEVIEKNQDGFLSSSTISRIVSGCEKDH